MHDPTTTPAPLTVLVLGVGGNVSQGILKALACSRLELRTVGACIDARSMGLFTTDKAYLSPPAAAPEFVDWLVDTCGTEGVDAVLSGVEPVLDVLAAHASRLLEETGARCIVSDPETMRIGSDKLLTYTWLTEQGLPTPATAESSDREGVERLVADFGFPLIAKPRFGKGSAGVRTLGNLGELELALQLEAYVIQQHVGQPSSEFTTATFSDRDGAVRGCAAIHRELGDGTTVLAETGPFDQVRRTAIEVAERLRPVGPANMQMRINEGIPTCFEINVRFSGTAPIRARLGFNDVEAALRHYVLAEPAVDLADARPGIAVRYWNEAYLDPGAIVALERDGHANPAQFDSTIEQWGAKR